MINNKDLILSGRTKTRAWFKKNIYYVGLAVSVLVLGLAITLTVVLKNIDTKEVGGNENTAIVFAMPIENATILTAYSGNTLIYSETLGHWEAHKAVDLQATEGAEVVSALSGTVTSITTNLLEGTRITITHEDGLITIYGSLSTSVEVAVGDAVTKGELIGYVANSAGTETAMGAHLHFEVLLNGIKTDPTAYLPISDK
ncbi:MAG: M23 family metallopeptidase [Clostridia bacterium]|jgi:murein DD-endopeptidase MepM/ murein hydrolase activator NlpD|nr:M23 family metallopeptidase [Clostridia bacterium]